MFSNINGLIKPTILDVKKWTFSERIHRILSIKRSKQLSITPTHIWNWTLTNLCLFLFLLAKFPVPRTTLQVSASLLIQKRGYNGVWCVREKKYWGNRTILNNLPDNFNNFLYTLILIVNTTFHSSGLTYPFFSLLFPAFGASQSTLFVAIDQMILWKRYSLFVLSFCLSFIFGF